MADGGLPTTPEGWGGVIAGVAAVFLGVRKGLQRIGVLEPAVDVQRVAEAVARAIMAEKSIDDAKHREALVEAIDKLCEVTRQEHEHTREQLREVNEGTRDRIAGFLSAFGNGMTAANTKLDMLVGRHGK